MTREEAIEKLEAFAPMVVDDTREALEMAIEALSAEPKTKCIARIEVDTEEIIKRIEEEYDITVGKMTREEAIKKLQKQKAEYLEEWVDYSGVAEAYDMAIEALEQEPVKHGEWVESKIPNELYVCSNCGGACWSYDYERTIVKSNFCPNCGAKMDKE